MTTLLSHLLVYAVAHEGGWWHRHLYTFWDTCGGFEPCGFQFKVSGTVITWAIAWEAEPSARLVVCDDPRPL